MKPRRSPVYRGVGRVQEIGKAARFFRAVFVFSRWLREGAVR